MGGISKKKLRLMAVATKDASPERGFLALCDERTRHPLRWRLAGGVIQDFARWRNPNGGSHLSLFLLFLPIKRMPADRHGFGEAARPRRVLAGAGVMCRAVR